MFKKKIQELGPKVLVVEDDAILARMYQERLVQEGYSVRVAHNGVEGVRKALVFKPAVIILDVYLPEQGGINSLRVLRSLPDTEKIPVIIITGATHEGHRKVALQHGAVEYLSKNEIHPKDIAEFVKKYAVTIAKRV